MFNKEETVLHFVGIGGIGMSGIAEVFLNQGYRVSGSDLAESNITRRLSQLGARIVYGHRAENIHGANVVVISSAVRPTNPEVVEARKFKIPVIPRAEMLGELMRRKIGIAVAGSHGKTTTTSMLATVLMTAGLDPTLVIGGKVDSLGGNAKLGQGSFVVAEADESDGSFLHLPATLGVVTNIDNDHLDHFGSLGALDDAFIDFVGKLPFYGLAAVCGEDPGVKRCLPRLFKPYQTYGFSEECHIWAGEVEQLSLGSSFNVYSRLGKDGVEDSGQNGSPSGDQHLGQKLGQKLGTIHLAVPGRHNILNALACITIALRLEIPFDVISTGLNQFKGVKRRFDIRWRNLERNQAIVDDYGHHPTEIAATLSAARHFWQGRVISVFQPHRYSRTLHCKDGFLSAFRQSDVVLLTDVYAAGEDPIPGVDSQSLADEMSKAAASGQMIEYVGDLGRAKERLLEILREGDLILCMGAGSITKLPDQLIDQLSSQIESRVDAEIETKFEAEIGALGESKPTRAETEIKEKGEAAVSSRSAQPVV